MKMLIYTTKNSKRLEYILQIVIQQLVGLDFQVTHQLETYQKSSSPKLNYSNQPYLSDEIFIKSHSLLFQKTISTQKIKISISENLPYFFESEDKEHSHLSFDIFAMSFYLISRYEEYLPFQKDKHNRFPAKESIAYQNNFLQLPLINLWAKRFRDILQKRYPTLIFKPHTYQFQPTYDIDMAWSYRNKGLFRNLGGYLQSITNFDFKAIRNRLLVQLGFKKDPFFTFDYLKQLHLKYRLQPKWFFLLGQRSQFDKNINPTNKAFQKLITQLSNKYDIGIHPSYLSNTDNLILEKEKNALEKIIKKEITISRQHFLKLAFPITYQNLVRIGIQEDFSIGYADQIGFRSSIANPYYWYDLGNEKVTKLKLHPFQIMDVTLREYLNLSKKEAIKEAISVIKICKEVDGVFCSLWHNSSFDEQNWNGWDKVYEAIIENASASFINK